MLHKTIGFFSMFIVACCFTFTPLTIRAAEMSEETQDCLGCHEKRLNVEFLLTASRKLLLKTASVVPNATP